MPDMVAIIDYGMGNVGSVKNAIAFLGGEAVLTNRPEDIEKASHIILPGVGAFGDGMRNLERSGLVDVLKKEVFENGKLFLGICLGMQLLAEAGEEGGEHAGLGWIKGRVRKLRVDEMKYRLPHVGWNDVSPKESATLFKDVQPSIFYFVHSFAVEPKEPEDIAATCDYGGPFAAAIQRKNIFGVQFHPEKSQKSGLAVLRNFLQLN
ncbi:MAG: imidazole glycerol phosphate synthase subunit HisH [Patescibacteria group bacterium]